MGLVNISVILLFFKKEKKRRNELYFIQVEWDNL